MGNQKLKDKQYNVKKKNKRQIMTDKTLHRKLMIDQHEPH